MKEIRIAGGSWESDEFWVSDKPQSDYIEPRPWQKEAYKKLKKKMFRWVVAPPGSGKTTLMSMLACNDITNNGVDKVIIIVPQNSIKKNYEKIAVCVDGKNIKLAAVVVENGSVERLKKFLKDDLSNSGINARVLICTHQSMCRIDKKLLKGNIAIWVDEAHHLSDDENDDESTNELGSRIAYAIHSCTSVNVATATPARHDRSTLISVDNRKKFTEHTYTVDRHIKENTKIEDMRYNVVKYDNSPAECITRLYKRSKEPTLIYLPSIRSLESSYDEDCKYEFTKKLVKAISPKHRLISTKCGWKINGLVVVNLVDEEHRKEKLELIATGEIDTIIALEMFKEGDDCPKLSRIIKVGIRKSLVVNGQMDGRLFRHYEGKKKIEIYQVISDNNTNKNDVNKFISMMILCIVSIESIIGQPTITMDKKKYKTGTIWEDYFGEQSINIRADLINDILSFDNFNDSKQYIAYWCDNNGIDDKDKAKIFASVLSYMASNTKALNKLNNVIDLDLIDHDDLFGWYSKAVGHDYLKKLRSACSSILNKQKLFKLAKSNAPRPKSVLLNDALKRYTSKNNECYDPEFNAEIRKLRPDWFNADRVANNKLKLLKLAKSDAPKPIFDTYLGDALKRYTSKNNKSYDPEFNAEIRKLRPDWFNTVKNRIVDTKRELLALAKSDAPKPISTTQLGNALVRYTNSSNVSYDPEFDTNIRKLRPDWFIESKKVTDTKRELLVLAKSDAPKPGCDTSIGASLRRYTSKNNECYDPEFDFEIRKLRPDWFNIIENRTISIKLELLTLAKSDAPKPKYDSALGGALKRYTNKQHKSYDPEFDFEIRKLRLDWFNTTASNKQELLKSAKSGALKPKYNTYIGAALGRYTNKNDPSYDIKFDVDIKKRKDWFKNERKKYA